MKRNRFRGFEREKKVAAWAISVRERSADSIGWGKKIIADPGIHLNLFAIY